LVMMSCADIDNPVNRIKKRRNITRFI